MALLWTTHFLSLYLPILGVHVGPAGDIFVICIFFFSSDFPGLGLGSKCVCFFPRFKCSSFTSILPPIHLIFLRLLKLRIGLPNS